MGFRIRLEQAYLTDLMSRQAKCIECGNWFYNHSGQMIYLPDTYDDRKCGKCNRAIDEDIRSRQDDPLTKKDYEKIFG